jgi:Response regulators consisting of a CheY-like receiver domain and a winged-helix DNA-binding domain
MANVNKIVLVVDDSPSIRREVKVILEKDGFTVREAGSEFGMFSAIEEYSVKADVVLMDLNLNDANGFDLVSKLRATEKYRNIPILILTENSSRDNVVMAKMLGVDGYIVKPIIADVLREKIRNIFIANA